MNKEESDLIIAEQNKSTEEILKAVAKVKSDYHELCNLKDMRIAELEYQLTHRNCLDCSNHSSKLRMRNLDLEKENAEAKERIKTLEYRCENIKDTDTMELVALQKENAELVKDRDRWMQVDKEDCENWSKDKKQLTKAKVALRNVIDYLGQFCSDYPDCVIEAEKILKEN